MRGLLSWIIVGNVGALIALGMSQEDTDEYERKREQVILTWQEVEVVAIRYGASLSK